MAYVIDPDGTETAVLARLGGLAGARVLELGCGDGRLTARYAPVARSVLAVDPDRQLIRAARTALPAALSDRVRYRVGRAETLSGRPRSFDAVFLSHSL